jgi:phage terminase large subunit GpA-like protein
METLLSTPELGREEQWLAGIIGACYRARPTRNPWEYAKEKVYLDERAAADPGFYDPELTPYTKRFQELGAAPAIDPLTGEFVHTITVRKSSRTGFTEGALNIIRWMPENQPGAVLYAIDSTKEAREISKDRLKPTLEAILSEAAQMPADLDDFGTLEMHLRNMTIRLAGSYAEGTFANKWLRKAFLDEVEVAPQDVGGSHPIDLVDSRGTTVDNYQKFFISKPKLPGTRFDQEYLAGTQEKFFVPCPHCRHPQELIWERVKYDHCLRQDKTWDLKKVKAETFYRCASPKACRIEMVDQRDMVRAGEWRITNPNHEPGKVSQQISDLYSPFEKVSWGNLAVMWLGAQNSITKIQHFWNNHMGLPFERHLTSVTLKDLLACRAGLLNAETGDVDGVPYECGQIPWRPTRMIATADIQDDVMKWIMWGIKGAADPADIEAAIVDYGQTLSYDDLTALKSKAYYVRGGDGTPFFATGGLVDSGYATYATYRFCIDDGEWYPTKGVGGVAAGEIVAEKEREFEGDQFIRYDFADYPIKVEFYEGRIKKRRRQLVWFFRDLADEKHEQFRDELMSEKLTAKKGEQPKWKKTSGIPNDWGDAGKAIVVALNIMANDIVEDFLAEEQAAAV